MQVLCQKKKEKKEEIVEMKTQTPNPNPHLGFVGFRDLGFIKFQFPIISLISFCNYSLFLKKFKTYVGYKRYLTNLK